MKKALMILVLAALVVGGAFAQRVGDTVQYAGQNYTVERIDGARVTMVLAPTLDGTWSISDGTMVMNISGANGVLTTFNPTGGNFLDAKNKGYIKVGDAYFRNLRKTGDLTWTGQFSAITFNTRTPDVATGTQWNNITLNLSADGRTISLDGGRTVFMTRR